MACSAVFGVFLAVFGALSPRARIGDCMKCDCECHCGRISPRDAMNDRLYWVEVNVGKIKGARFAAWRTGRDPDYPWIADLPPVYESSGLIHEAFTDRVVTVIHEIIPEE